MKRFFYIGLLLICSLSLRAEEPEWSNISSPQVSDMFRAGAVQTSLYTGRMRLSIPLYHLNDPDFPLDISIDYNAEGFQWRKPSGYVGFNWYLNAGGCITREVKGYPDEKIDFSGEVECYGMLAAIRRNKISADCAEGIFHFEQGCVYDNVPNASSAYWLNKSSLVDIDYLPDIFHFQFCGYQGSFMIDNAGTPTILSGDFVDIDLSKLEVVENHKVPQEKPTPLVYTSITIRTIDGYVYVFGGDISSIEYTFPLSGPSCPMKSSNPTINAWHLRSVTAPNGRQLHFQYKPPENDNAMYLFSEYRLAIPQKQQEGIATIHNYAGYSLTKQCILESIAIHDIYPLQIKFINSVSNYQAYTSYGQCSHNYELNTIMVQQENSILQQVDLVYDYRNDNLERNYWRFLSSVHLSGQGTYLLDYWHEFAYPSIDIPDEQELQRNAGFWEKSCAQAMLKTITYPTGGKQLFCYGRHNYSIHQYYHTYGKTNVELKNEETGGFVGGARIESIETYDGETLVEKRSYDYNNSGIYFNRTGIRHGEHWLCPTLGASYSRLDTHIGYSCVTEIIQNYPSKDTYSIQYEFNIPMPYLSASDPNIHIIKTEGQENNIDAFFSSILSYNSQLCQYGKLQSKIYKNNQNKIVASYTYNYNGLETSPTTITPQPKFQYGRTKEIVIFSSTLYTSVARKMQVYPDVINQEVVTYYDVSKNDAGIHSTKEYKYDKKFRLSLLVTRNSDQVEHFTAYRYPDEFAKKIYSGGSITTYPTNALWGYSYLSNLHILHQPIEQLQGFYDKDNRPLITAGKIYLYSAKNVWTHPSEYDWSDTLPYVQHDTMVIATRAPISPITGIYDWTITEKELRISSPIRDYTPLAIQDNAIIHDERYATICQSVYTPKWQQILCRTPIGQPTTYYKWNGIYLTSTTIGDQTISYSYIPYVGVRYMTDPRGITTYYCYDPVGRLSEIYKIVDGKKQVIESYYYHYPTQ